MVAGVAPISTQISLIAQQFPDDPAITCDGRTVTWAELDVDTNRRARAFAAHGVGGAHALAPGVVAAPDRLPQGVDLDVDAQFCQVHQVLQRAQRVRQRGHVHRLADVGVGQRRADRKSVV